MLAHFSRVLIEAQRIGKNTRTFRRAHSLRQPQPPKLELGHAGKEKSILFFWLQAKTTMNAFVASTDASFNRCECQATVRYRATADALLLLNASMALQTTQ